MAGDEPAPTKVNPFSGASSRCRTARPVVSGETPHSPIKREGPCPRCAAGPGVPRSAKSPLEDQVDPRPVEVSPVSAPASYAEGTTTKLWLPADQ